MLNLYPRLSASTRSRDGDANSSDDGLARPRAFFGIAVACVAVLLFCCVLAATASALEAGVFAATAALVLVVLGCFAPRTSWIRRRGRRTGRPATTVLPLRARSSGACACAPADADAPPAFAYVCPLEAGDGEEAVPGSVVITVICPVCLEGIHDGEMVRQLPACKHVFHVECIDMWLHSNRTCPMCRCVISPPQTVTAKASESEEASASASDDEALPPV